MNSDTKHRQTQGGKTSDACNKTKTAGNTKVNNFRLSDISKLIEGRHGYWYTDAQWAKRYFFAALPHLIVSRHRWLDAVRDWVCECAQILVAEKGFAWIDDEARKCHAKTHKTPSQDRLCRLLQVQDHEVHDFKLCTLTAANRPAKVREAERREAKVRYKQELRARDPKHTPRNQSKAALARAAGDTADAIRARKWREKRKAETSQVADAQAFVTECERVSDPSEQGHQTTDAQEFVTTANGFRTQQYRLGCERVSDPTTILTHTSGKHLPNGAQTSPPERFSVGCQ